jgi:hypothetical protein
MCIQQKSLCRWAEALFAAVRPVGDVDFEQPE